MKQKELEIGWYFRSEYYVFIGTRHGNKWYFFGVGEGSRARHLLCKNSVHRRHHFRAAANKIWKGTLAVTSRNLLEVRQVPSMYENNIESLIFTER